VSEHTGKWAEDEESKLKVAVQTLGNNDWVAIAALVPGRTKNQCNNRWLNGLNLSIDRANERSAKSTEGEDNKLKDALQTHGGKNWWDEKSAIVPGRTKKQCWSRWKDALDPSIDRASGRTGKWAKDEDSKLEDAVETHGDNDFVN
jgi:hypothetical protein